MNHLAKLQGRFQSAILSEEPAPGLFAGEGPANNRGFGVYLHAYRARLKDALSDNFPVLRRALGDDAFNAMALAYIAEHPSHLRSIRWFGDALVEFLAATPDRLPHPALVDLARMDWATRAAFDAADATALTFADLTALPPADWPQRRFKLVPSLQLVDLAWGVEANWKALNDDAEANSEEPLPLPHLLLVWRPQLDCCWRSSADPCEATVLRALARATSFADCCTLIADSGDRQAAQTAASLLQRWISEGLLARD